MDFIIGWVCICILLFYIVRANLAGYFIFPFANRLVKIWNGAVAPGLRVNSNRRNFYLWVLNPFFWSIWSCFKKGQKNVDNLRSAWRVFNKKFKSKRI